jgi:hypothetical protein
MVYNAVVRNDIGIFNKGKPVILCFDTEAEMGRFVKEVINRKYINIKAPATEEDLRLNSTGL